jgi:hypothetical protein
MAATSTNRAKTPGNELAGRFYWVILFATLSIRRSI